MKKISLILVFVILTVSLSGCSCKLFTVETESYQNSFTLSIDEDVKEYLPYKEIPTYTLNFDGEVNITKNRTGEFELVFYNNDDFKISKIISKLITEYSEKERISFRTLSEENTAETWLNTGTSDNREKEYIKVKDNKITNEIAFITLENGLQLSFNYAKIIDFENNIYYRWQKTENIRIVLHYPLMIHKQNDQKEMLILALPNGVIYNFDTTTKKISSLIGDDKFLGSEYYTYEYPHSSSEDKDIFMQYYVENFDGVIKDNTVSYTYLGYNYTNTFNENDFFISLTNE